MAETNDPVSGSETDSNTDPVYSSESHGPNAPLVSDSLFDFMIHLRKNTDTFDPVYYDTQFILGHASGPHTTSRDIMPDEHIREMVHEYTGEPTDLPLLT